MALLADPKRFRWYFVGLVAIAIAISYFDRQTVSVAIHCHSTQYPHFGISNSPICRRRFCFRMPPCTRSAGAWWIGSARAAAFC